jgi:hypothetical protein
MRQATLIATPAHGCKSWQNQRYDEGLCFFPPGGARIVSQQACQILARCRGPDRTWLIA